MKNKTLFYCAAVAIAFALIVSLIYRPDAKAENLYLMNNENNASIISVSGEGVIKAPPNKAIVSLAVVTEAADVKKAQQENSRLANAVMKAIKALDIDEKDIKTQGYIVTPVYNYEKKEHPPTISGYRVENEVSITLKDVEKVGALIDAGIDAGANRVNNISFYLEDEKLQEQVLREAIKDARKKAQIMADELGKQIIGVKKVTGGWSNIGPVPVRYAMKAEMSVGGGALYDTPINPGETEVRASVHIEFEISK
jgi:hypothetical protein